MHPRIRALALVAALAVTGPGVPVRAAAAPPEARRLVLCQAAIARVAGRFVTARRKTLGRCVEEAVRCAALSSGSTWQDDGCLATAGARCRAKLGGLARRRTRLEGAGLECLAGGSRATVSSEGFFGEDGLAFARVVAFCPAIPAREGEPADVGICQASALGCTADTALGAAAPRAAELLARSGVPIGPDAACLAARLCGNGELDELAGEECDDGAANSDTRADACRTTCREPACGDGAVDSDEDCDDGNDVSGDGCDAGCFVEEGVCGNRIVEGDEECDDGNQRDGDGCDVDCLLEEGVCGDGVEDADEDCDEGPRNSDVLPDRCRTDCTFPECGDGVVDPGEGEECEPPGTLLCDADCASRLPLPLPARMAPAGAGARRVAPAAPGRDPDDLARCQQALLRAAARELARARTHVGRCVLHLARCVVGIPESADPEGIRFDACLAAADRRCRAEVAARAERDARTAAKVAARCGAPLERLLDPAAGLGFEELAAACPFAGGSPSTGDLTACVLDRARCLGENAVARAVPRANELLWELDLDPEQDFPCVTDPDELAEE
jgi:cysteine-rich repeat protein